MSHDLPLITVSVKSVSPTEFRSFFEEKLYVVDTTEMGQSSHCCMSMPSLVCTVFSSVSIFLSQGFINLTEDEESSVV